MISRKDMYIYEDTQRILLKSGDFICLRPGHALSGYVSNYNITFPTKALFLDGFTIIPSGCATINIENNGQHLSACLDGPATKPYIIGSKNNQPEMLISIEFKPAGLYTFTGINQNELTNQSIPLDAINSKLCKSLYESIEKSTTIRELAANLDSLLQENMYAANHPELGLIYQNIIASSGKTTIKELSNITHYSERQLTRIFNQHIGISTKSFARLIRINNAFRLLKKPQNSLSFVSDMTGFHDLSHFIRDFKLVSGTTPQEYRGNMSAFYNNTTRL